ncbi:NUDIX hydrolase [Pseudomonas palleroniana]|uniref:NUDIX hydrolase n=1 Tax=Pseudomonas palleroniana TaxID=191390 RepID=UPI001FD5A088|nr:NUDIX domain-containing protein [Pseudomonas palleroniana]UOP10581.1 NUDIX domain-containing protein [Pseudomonas palleroniana]
MREREAARLLIISPANKVLLFRFVHKEGALAGSAYWATPGGGVEEGEDFHTAAVRELREETGIVVGTVQAPVADRRFELMLPSGETVLAIEQYFVIHAQNEQLSRDGWTEQEVQVMADHHWWSAEELRSTTDTVWPQALADILERAEVFEATA